MSDPDALAPRQRCDVHPKRKAIAVTDDDFAMCGECSRRFMVCRLTLAGGS